MKVILALWTEDEVTFEGTYYQVRGAINQPRESNNRISLC